MKLRVLPFFSVFFVPILLQGQITREETVVRTAYAKLAYAIQLHEIYNFSGLKTEGTLAQYVAAREMHFALSDIRGGSLSDIQTDKYSDLVTRPDGREVLHVRNATIQNTENGKQAITNTAAAEWGEGQTVTEDWDLQMAKAVPILEAQNEAVLSRYVACTVTVSYRNKQSTYKALWLFGKDKQGNPFTLGIDTIVGIYGGALNYVINNPVYPAVMLETKLRDTPGLRDWFAAHIATCGASRDACCDPETLQCGISIASLQRSLAGGKP